MSEADCEAGAGGARVTTPGGVPNLPVGALTLDTLVSRLEDMSPEAMRERAGERWPSIFGSSTGGDIMSDLSLSGIIAKLFSGFNSVVANADPADIDGPEDLPGLLWDFITSLPVVGELVGLLEAIIGEYDGDDEVLLAIQEIFMPLRRLVQLVAGKDVDWPTAGEVAEGWEDLGDAILSAGVQLVRGVIPEWMLPPTNIGRITGELPNLVADGEFLIPPVGESGPPVGAWFRDGAGGRASLVGAGVPSELRVQPVAVAPGQKYQPLAVVSCESATGAAGSVQLVVVEWNDIDLYPTNIRVIASWQPSGTKAAQPITGTYVVPAGVRYAGLGIVTTEGFTGGTLRVHKVDGPSTGLLEMSWTKNLEKRWEQSAKLMGIVDTDLDGDVDLVDVWNTLWAGHLKPLGWVPTVAQDVIDGIYNGFANFGELLDLDRPRTDALDVIYNLLGIGVSNKTSLAALEAEIRLLKSAGNTIAAPFDGAAGGMPSGTWGVFRSWGGGSGDIVYDGKGNAVWSRSGGSTRGRFYRHLTSGSPTQISKNSCVVTGVLASDPPDTGSDPAAWTYLGFSVSGGSEVSYGQLRIGRSKIAIEAVVAGVLTTLVESVTINPRAGQVFAVYRGETGETNAHKYVVTQNGNPVEWTTGNTYFVDAGSTIKTGSGFRGTGIGMQAGSRTVIPIILFDQWTPAGLGVLTCAEVL